MAAFQLDDWDSDRDSRGADPVVLDNARQETGLDIDKVFEILESPDLSVEEDLNALRSYHGYRKNVVLLMGETGAGKTTLCHSLQGVPLVRRSDDTIDVDPSALDEWEDVVAAAGHGSSTSGIGHSVAQSRTLVPKAYHMRGIPLSVVDTAGFMETRGPEYELVTQIAFSDAVRSFPSRVHSIWFVLPLAKLAADRWNYLIVVHQRLKDLLKCETDEELVKRNPRIFFLITKFPDGLTKEQFAARLKNAYRDIKTNAESEAVTKAIRLKMLKELARHSFLYHPIDTPDVRELVLKRMTTKSIRAKEPLRRTLRSHWLGQVLTRKLHDATESWWSSRVRNVENALDSLSDEMAVLTATCEAAEQLQQQLWKAVSDRDAAQTRVRDLQPVVDNGRDAQLELEDVVDALRDQRNNVARTQRETQSEDAQLASLYSELSSKRSWVNDKDSTSKVEIGTASNGRDDTFWTDPYYISKYGLSYPIRHVEHSYTNAFQHYVKSGGYGDRHYYAKYEGYRAAWSYTHVTFYTYSSDYWADELRTARAEISNLETRIDTVRQRRDRKQAAHSSSVRSKDELEARERELRGRIPANLDDLDDELRSSKSDVQRAHAAESKLKDELLAVESKIPEMAKNTLDSHTAFADHIDAVLEEKLLTLFCNTPAVYGAFDRIQAAGQRYTDLKGLNAFALDQHMDVTNVEAAFFKIRDGLRVLDQLIEDRIENVGLDGGMGDADDGPDTDVEYEAEDEPAPAVEIKKNQDVELASPAHKGAVRSNVLGIKEGKDGRFAAIVSFNPFFVLTRLKSKLNLARKRIRARTASRASSSNSAASPGPPPVRSPSTTSVHSRASSTDQEPVAYSIGDNVEVKDQETGSWISAKVTGSTGAHVRIFFSKWGVDTTLWRPMQSENVRRAPAPLSPSDSDEKATYVPVDKVSVGSRAQMLRDGQWHDIRITRCAPTGQGAFEASIIGVGYDVRIWLHTRADKGILRRRGADKSRPTPRRGRNRDARQGTVRFSGAKGEGLQLTMSLIDSENNATTQPMSIKLRYKRPVNTSMQAWIVRHLFYFLTQADSIIQAADKVCSCSKMTAGTDVEYMWRDGDNPDDVQSLSARAYANKLLKSLNATLTKLPLAGEASQYPATFMDTAREGFRRLMRLYAHQFHHHYDALSAVGEDGALNDAFKVLLIFGAQHDLLTRADVLPIISLAEHVLSAARLNLF